MKLRLVKNTILIIMITMLVMAFASCASTGESDKDKLTICCTIFPIYDWVTNITENVDGIDVKLLIEDGTDMHSYQPDIKAVSEIISSDVVVYVGGESDEWLVEALKNNPNDGRICISLMDLARDYIYEEEIVEGMMAQEEEEIEYDEHIWLSVKSAQIIVKCISEELCELDKEDAELITDNTEGYIKDLHNIDYAYEEYIDTIQNRVMIVADRFPFRYLCEDYDIDYYAAFPGCTTDANADFETIIFLGNKAKEVNAYALVTTENYANDISSGVSESAGRRLDTICLNSMQAVTKRQIEEGTTYISICEKNLEALKQILR